MTFNEENYKIIKEVIPATVANLIYAYFINRRRSASYLYSKNLISPYAEEWGIFNDDQVPNSYAIYGDVLMDTLLEQLKPRMEEETNLKLIETYSYARIYSKGNNLTRHKDRDSCQISTTLNLGGDSWPIFLEPSGEFDKEGVKVSLSPGDMLIYKGCHVEHWREPFEGEICAQVFLHYNDVNSELGEKNKYDNRAFVGLPAFSKNIKGGS